MISGAKAQTEQGKEINSLAPQRMMYPAAVVYSDTSGVRRRDRRPTQIAELKANRKARLAGQGMTEHEQITGRRGVVSKIKQAVKAKKTKTTSHDKGSE